MKLLNIFNQEKANKVSEEANVYVQKNKEEFDRKMDKLHEQSKVTHHKAKRTQQEAIKLNKTIEDITQRLAIAFDRNGVLNGHR